MDHKYTARLDAFLKQELIGAPRRIARLLNILGNVTNSDIEKVVFDIYSIEILFKEDKIKIYNDIFDAEKNIQPITMTIEDLKKILFNLKGQ